MELLISVSMKVCVVWEGMVVEFFVIELWNGVYIVLVGLWIESMLINLYIGYGYVDEENFYRECFVVCFLEVGD